jgi:hypothetical protein
MAVAAPAVAVKQSGFTITFLTRTLSSLAATNACNLRSVNQRSDKAGMTVSARLERGP